MRKAIAILLFVCFAIFHFGYYAVYFSVNKSIENRWKDQIYGDQLAKLEERILEIPLNAPYMANQEEFHSTNTRFEKDGQYYRAIKQRYQNDTLQVVYVPDTSRKVLDSTVQKWITSLVEDDLPQDQNGKNFLKLFAKDYLESDVFGFQALHRMGFELAIGFIFSPYMSPFFKIDSPPPQFS